MLPNSIAGSWKAACDVVPITKQRRIASALCGIESASFDGVPLIGRVPRMDGIYVVCGFSGHGFQLAPAVGQAVAAQLSGKDAPELNELAATRPIDLSQSALNEFVNPSSRVEQA
jgi:sarcosine oxidase subunit beta